MPTQTPFYGARTRKNSEVAANAALSAVEKSPLKLKVLYNGKHPCIVVASRTLVQSQTVNYSTVQNHHSCPIKWRLHAWAS